MKLENARLQICFAEPGLWQTQRFDRTAIVTEVVLDGKYTFCTPEQRIPGRRTTNGIGLCGEFVLPGAAEEAKAGQWFCKPGVGLLKQPEDNLPYDMWRQYECQPFAVTAEASPDGMVFRQKAAPCGGYAAAIEKAFSLRDNQLILDITVCNTGEKPYELQEYQHNFVSLNGMELDRGYVLEVSCDKTLPEIEGKTMRWGDEIPLPSAVRAEKTRVYWQKDMHQRVLYHRSEDIAPEAPYRWKLRHEHTALSVSEETAFCPSRMDFWAVEHCACTEFYRTVWLAPGETTSWRRVWTFEA